MGANVKFPFSIYTVNKNVLNIFRWVPNIAVFNEYQVKKWVCDQFQQIVYAICI